jgi:hypothetical protein
VPRLKFIAEPDFAVAHTEVEVKIEGSNSERRFTGFLSIAISRASRRGDDGREGSESSSGGDF